VPTPSSEAVDVALDQAMIDIATRSGEPWKTGGNLSWLTARLRRR